MDGAVQKGHLNGKRMVNIRTEQLKNSNSYNAGYSMLKSPVKANIEL